MSTDCSRSPHAMASGPAPLPGRRSGMIGLGIIVTFVLIAIFAPFLAPYEPNEILIGKEDVGQVRLALRPRPRVRRRDPAAHHGHRRQRAGRVLPDHLRVAGEPHPRLLHRDAGARRRRHDRCPRRVSRRLVRQHRHAAHGCDPRLPVAAPGDRHRGRARAGAAERPHRHRHRHHAGVRPGHARPGLWRSRRTTTFRPLGRSAPRPRRSSSAGSSPTR